jgi:large subunit ribosomal protein LP0
MSTTKKEKKVILMKKTYELLSKHNQVVMVSLTNVGSSQVQKIRRGLADVGATLLIGKNTIIKKAMNMRASKLADQKNIPDKAFFEQFGGNAMPQLTTLIDQTKGKLGLIFSDMAAFELKDIIKSNRVKCAAKVGMVAQCDVVVPPGSTGLDPS